METEQEKYCIILRDFLKKNLVANDFWIISLTVVNKIPLSLYAVLCYTVLMC